MKKNILYGLFALSLATVGLTSCDPQDNDDHSLGGSVIAQDDVVLAVNKVSDKEFTITNNSKAIPGVNYYFCTDGKKLVEAPAGSSMTLTVKKNGVYTVILYAFSGCDQKMAKSDIVVDWFSETSADPQWLGFQNGTNLLAESNPSISTWFADGGWSALGTQPTVDGDIKALEFTIPEGVGGDQWQAQVHVNETGVKLSSGKKYDFSVAIISSADFEGNGATIKPQQEGDDNTFFSDARHKIVAGVNVITLSDCAGFDGNLKVAMDFAGAPVGTKIVVKNLFVTEHQAGNVALDAPLTFFDYSSEANLLLAKEATVSTWFADGGWTALGTQPEVEGNAATYELTIPEGMGGDQWQGQVHLAFEDVKLNSGKKYDFSVVILSDKDVKGVTVKPQNNSDDNTFFSDGRHDVTGGVPCAVRLPENNGFDGPFQLCLDFGGAPAGTKIKIIGIYVGEHK